MGEPLPPQANVPARVSDLAAMQRGGRIIAQFTVPQRTTEDLAIKTPLRLDFRIGTAGAPFNADEWAARAKALSEGPVTNGVARYEIPASEWTNQEAILAVRAIGANGKEAGWSNFVIVPVVPPPETPADVRAAATAEGARLTWRARGGSFRVFRKTEGGNFAEVANVAEAQWTDPGTEFGTRYTYLVQTVVKLDNNKEAESDLSAETGVTPEDRFPPAAPSGLRAAAAPNSIELAWERSTEPDLAGYRVYRAAANGPFEKIADVSQVPSYSDHNVEHDKTYRYAISAVDQSGNESPRSAVVEVSYFGDRLRNPQGKFGGSLRGVWGLRSLSPK